jgi:hypothetical protein
MEAGGHTMSTDSVEADGKDHVQDGNSGADHSESGGHDTQERSNDEDRGHHLLFPLTRVHRKRVCGPSGRGNAVVLRWTVTTERVLERSVALGTDYGHLVTSVS